MRTVHSQCIRSLSSTAHSYALGLVAVWRSVALLLLPLLKPASSHLERNLAVGVALGLTAGKREAKPLLQRLRVEAVM